MTAWTNYVKQYAKDKGITYKNALKDPAVLLLTNQERRNLLNQ